MGFGEKFNRWRMKRGKSLLNVERLRDCINRLVHKFNFDGGWPTISVHIGKDSDGRRIWATLPVDDETRDALLAAKRLLGAGYKRETNRKPNE